MKETLQFYNKFDKKLLKDYLKGNKRIETAILELSQFIPTNSKNVIDIGCGLGWSTHEFSVFIKTANFIGVDLSPVLIEKAKVLFNQENLQYKVFDVNKSLPKSKFDAVIMIDVYEHIQADHRKEFNKSLKSLLNDQGRIIMSCPSRFHQKYLREKKPEGLQPVDEDIDLKVIKELADDLNGELIYFEYKNIWRMFDYFYAVIEVNPLYGGGYDIRSKNKLYLEKPKLRINRVQNKLDIVIDQSKGILFRSFFLKVKNKIKRWGGK